MWCLKEYIFSGNYLLESCNLSKAYLRPNKTSLDLIGLSVELLQAVSQFRSYLKFFVGKESTSVAPRIKSAIVSIPRECLASQNFPLK